MSEDIEIAAEIKHETSSAFLLYDGRNDKEGNPIEVWVPKSKVENNEDGTFSMPEWLAQDKGMI